MLGTAAIQGTMRKVGGDASLPAALAAHISFGGSVCLPTWPIWVPAFSPEHSGQAHKHVNPQYSTQADPSLRAPQPCPPRMQVGPGCWHRAQHGVNYYTMLEPSRFPPSCCPGFHPSLPGLPRLLQLQLPGVPGSILAHETSCFPVRRSCFYLTPFQLPKLARTGSCTVCLGRRCVATNYF